MAKSGIHIKEANRGKFTARAQKNGRSVAAQATHDLNDPNAPTSVKREANFARVAERGFKRSGRRKTSRSSGRR